MWGKAAADMSKQRYVRVDLGELALAYDCVWGSMSQIVACSFQRLHNCGDFCDLGHPRLDVRSRGASRTARLCYPGQELMAVIGVARTLLG
jgi:hypothetical protein